jgi:two-component system nitrogen regulation sensor histidine kinase NtrY
VTLRARLLLSALLLSLATTGVLALVVRASWQTAEAERFQAEFEGAVTALEGQLERTGPELKQKLAPLCAHDPIVDSALIGLEGGTLGPRLLSLRARVPELKKSLGVDALYLVSKNGEIIAGDNYPEDARPDEISAWAGSVSEEPTLRTVDELAFEAGCQKRSHGMWVALVAARTVAPLLEEAGRRADLKLSLAEEAGRIDFDPSALYIEERPVAALRGAILRAERSRKSLRANLAHLDSEVLTAAAGTLGGALLLAFFLSRGLARPVVQFAERTRQAVQGRVEMLPVSGGPELEEAARAFNATLADLAALRERLKLTEKIAARREVARQIAHEIKNPLSPIRTSIETLRKLKERGHEEFDSYFEETTKTVLDEVRRINTLVSHFSEYARVPSPSPRPTDVSSLVEDIARLHQDLGPEVRFESDGPEVFSVDPDQISQVVTNLLKNAVEATSGKSDAKVLVLVTRTKDGREVRISVTDNGPGLSPESAQKIFEPYFTTKSGGSGLGLPISHRIAVEHGGDLTYTTSPLGGAEFILVLPVAGPPLLAEATPD